MRIVSNKIKDLIMNIRQINMINLILIWISIWMTIKLIVEDMMIRDNIKWTITLIYQMIIITITLIYQIIIIWTII